MGRPSKFAQALAEKICERLSDGESLRTICKSDGMPSKTTVMRWLADEELSAFRDQYARAREAQADRYAEEVIEIADEDCAFVKRGSISGDESDAAEVEVAFDSAAVARNRLRVDARKWYASKLAPKKYGDKIQQEVSGPDGEPLVVEVVRFGGGK